MNLPPTLRFPRLGYWVLHLVAIPVVFAGGVVLGNFHATEQGHAGHAVSVPPPQPGANPIRDEMIALQDAFDALNRGVVLGDATGVAEAFHQVHARKQVTAAAIEAGTARPPQNADRMDDFVARDEAFHALIEATVEAAGRNDMPALRSQADLLREGCIGCHEEFRGER